MLYSINIQQVFSRAGYRLIVKESAGGLRDAAGAQYEVCVIGQIA